MATCTRYNMVNRSPRVPLFTTSTIVRRAILNQAHDAFVDSVCTAYAKLATSGAGKATDEFLEDVAQAAVWVCEDFGVSKLTLGKAHHIAENIRFKQINGRQPMLSTQSSCNC